jgi:hypothetical protein
MKLSTEEEYALSSNEQRLVVPCHLPRVSPDGQVRDVGGLTIFCNAVPFWSLTTSCLGPVTSVLARAPTVKSVKSAMRKKLKKLLFIVDSCRTSSKTLAAGTSRDGGCHDNFCGHLTSWTCFVLSLDWPLYFGKSPISSDGSSAFGSGLRNQFGGRKLDNIPRPKEKHGTRPAIGTENRIHMRLSVRIGPPTGMVFALRFNDAE